MKTDEKEFWERATDEDLHNVIRVSGRVSAINFNHGYGYLDTLERILIEMDVLAAHLTNYRLDWNKLLSASDVDFFHDVIGITENIDRETGILDNFIPKCKI